MRLARRAPCPPSEFEQAMAVAEARCRCAGGYRPETPPVEDLEPGTYYLDEVDGKMRRRYCRKIT